MTEQDTDQVLEQWLHTEIGGYASRWEYRQISQLLNNVFGYHAIQIGMPYWDLLRKNRISHKWYTHSKNEQIAAATPLVLCEAEQLPFASESIDLLVLPHTLETASDPHQVLREAHRVLVPEGQLVLSGFNPWSLWGLRERLPGLEPLLPVNPADQLAPGRVVDWLELLSFELTAEQQGCYVPYCQQRKWIRRWHFMDRWGEKWWPMFASVYVLSATKRVNSITMVGLDWSKKRAGTRSQVAAVAQRQSHHTHSE